MDHRTSVYEHGANFGKLSWNRQRNFMKTSTTARFQGWIFLPSTLDIKVNYYIMRITTDKQTCRLDISSWVAICPLSLPLGNKCLVLHYHVSQVATSDATLLSGNYDRKEVSDISS